MHLDAVPYLRPPLLSASSASRTTQAALNGRFLLNGEAVVLPVRDSDPLGVKVEALKVFLEKVCVTGGGGTWRQGEGVRRGQVLEVCIKAVLHLADDELALISGPFL